MTTIAYVFLDVTRDELIPLAEQQLLLDKYAAEQELICDELLVEQSFSPSVPLRKRVEGERLLQNIQPGDVLLTLRAKWVLGSPREALLLLNILKEKKVSLFCVDLDGDLVHETERKLAVSQGIAPLVYALCEALAIPHEKGLHGAAIRAGKAKQKKDGKYMGGPVPFGFLVAEDGCLQEDAAQQVVIEEMSAMKKDRWSYRDIAKKMKELHELHFSHEGVRRILLKNRKQ